MVEDLLKLKPDFPTRGRVLIKHYIKFEEIVERMIEGLNKVGLSIDLIMEYFRSLKTSLVYLRFDCVYRFFSQALSQKCEHCL